jgi:hypothetical protein
MTLPDVLPHSLAGIHGAAGKTRPSSTTRDTRERESNVIDVDATLLDMDVEAPGEPGAESLARRSERIAVIGWLPPGFVSAANGESLTKRRENLRT